MTRSGEGLAELVDYVVQRHFPNHPDEQNTALALLDGVCAHFAELVSHWQVLGFVHGVLNTDNALLCGETIDYGPCAFMDYFDPTASFSSIDRQGRYAWPNQPGINLDNIIRNSVMAVPPCSASGSPLLAIGLTSS